MNVLITTDGSDAALESIQRYCALIPGNATSHTVLTVDELQAYGIIDSVDQAEMDRLQHQNCQRILENARTILEGHGIQAKYVEHAGQAADAILTYADNTKPDLIVIGARGNGALTRLLLGSTSDAVVHHAKCSVWVVRPNASHADARTPHVTVAYDGSDASKRAVQFVRSMGLPASCRISLVALIRRPENLPDEIPYDERLQEQLRQDLHAIRDQFPGNGPQVDFVVQETRHVGHGLVDFAVANHSALIVLGDKGRSAIARFFIGSISRFVLHHAPCSVLVSKS